MGNTRHPSPEPRTQRLTRRNTGRFGWGRYHYPRSIPRVSETLRGRGLKRQTLPLLGLGREVLSKNAESLRNSDALMRVAVPRRRGPAGLRDLFCFCRNRDLYIRRSWFSACARQGRYHHPRRALRAAETSGPRLLKRLTCRFLRSCSHQGISPCPLLSPIGAKQECNNLGAGTAIVRFEQPIANAVGDAVLHGPHHRVIAIAAGRLIT